MRPTKIQISNKAVGCMALIGFLALALNPAPSMAQSAAGGVESPFDLGGSARVLGMGGAAAAMTGEGDGFFENPAVLATLREHQVLTFHSPLFQDAMYDSIGYFNPVAARSSFGLALARIGVSDIFQTQNNIQALSTFSDEQWQGFLGYGFRAVEGLDVGGTVKYFLENLGSSQGSGVGADLGVLYHFAKTQKDFNEFGYRNITLGFSATNLLQPQTKLFQNVSSPLRVYRPALSYLYLFPGSKNQLWLTVEGEVPDGGGNPSVKAGLEYGWNRTVYGRAGYDGSSPTAGVGLRFSNFELDYAFNQRDMGALHRFSLTYRFGPWLDPLQEQKIDLLKWVARSYTTANDYDPAIKAWQNVLKEFPDDEEAAKAIPDLEAKRRKAVADDLRLARLAMSQGDLQKALSSVAKVLSLDPQNRDAKAILRMVDQKTLISSNYANGVDAYTRENYGLAVQYLQMVYEVDAHYRDVDRLYHDAKSRYEPLKTMSKDLTSLYAKGVDYYMAGDYAKAIESWQQVLDKDPGNYLVRRNLEDAKSHLKDTVPPGGPTTVKQETSKKP